MIRRLSSYPMLAAALAVTACSSSGVTAPGTGGTGTPAGGVVSNWSDPATWGGTVPAVNTDVTVPAGRTVILDVAPPALGKVTIVGKLQFANKDLALTASSIIVNGALEVGTEANPYTNRAVITLTGTDPNLVTSPFGAKVLGVAGTIDLHGQKRTTWLRLNATAALGSTTLSLEKDPGWKVGERIVVASTDYNDAWSEDFTITAVSGTSVTIDRPLQWAHYGVLQTIAGKSVDERAEVALLSRNITIQSDSAPNGFGGNVMIVRGGVARIEGVELYQMGQKHLVGRYPMHWHLMGSVAGQYIRASSVWKSNNRCITVHGTNDADLENNVCYDHLGHGYFLEDGAETGNTFKYNIGLRTRVPATADQILGSDSRAATFWITNPANTYVGNVAAGSQAQGFWMALPAAPTGLSTGIVAFPRRTPLGTFDGNVAHTNRDFAFNIDNGPRADGTTETTSYSPRTDPSNGNSAAVVANFTNFTAWKNSSNAIWSRGDNHTFSGALLVDNRIGVTLPGNAQVVTNSTIIGSSANQNANSNLNTQPFILGYEFYDGQVGFNTVTFANFQGAGSQAMGAVGIKLNNSFSINPGNYAIGATFINATLVSLQTPAADRDGNKMAVLLDSTGSITGTAGRYVVANSPILFSSACTQRTDWNAYICPGRYTNLSIRSTDTSQSVNPLTITRDDGVAVQLVGIGNSATTTTNKQASMNLPTSRKYTIAWNGTTPTKPFFTLTKAAAGDAITLTVPYSISTVNVYRNYNRTAPIAAVSSAAEVDASAGDKYWYDTSRQVIYMKLAATTSADYSTTLTIEPK